MRFHFGFFKDFRIEGVSANSAHCEVYSEPQP
jgi:hypothetical protein